MSRTRRDFTPEFKLQVARMVLDQGLSVSQICKDMDLSDSAVRKWVKQLSAEVQGLPVIGMCMSERKRGSSTLLTSCT